MVTPTSLSARLHGRRRSTSPMSSASGALMRGLASHFHLNLTGRVFQESCNPAGSGGFCDVYRGLSVAHGKWVAIKKFRGHAVGDNARKFKKCLARELEVWAMLHHPNVLPLLGYTVDDGLYPSLVSEWMPNGTILQYVLAHPLADVMSLVRGFAGGLFYLHSKGIVHSDMKSDNILVDSSGVPKLADFGISYLFIQSGTDSTDNVKGSIRWMPIELFCSDTALSGSVETKRTLKLQADIWSFGMTVYELLTKGRPYAHIQSDVQVIFAIAQGKLPCTPSNIEMGIADPIEQMLWGLCNKCWSLEPTERPSMLDITFELVSRDRRTGSNSGRDVEIENIDSVSVESHGDDCETDISESTTSEEKGNFAFQSSQLSSTEKHVDIFAKLSSDKYKRKQVAECQPSLLSQTMKRLETTLPISHNSDQSHFYPNFLWERHLNKCYMPIRSSTAGQTMKSLHHPTVNDHNTEASMARRFGDRNGEPTTVRRAARSALWREHFHGMGWLP